MPISSTSLNPSSGASAPASQTQSPSAKPPKHDDASSSSTIVTLSEQGKKLSQSQQNAASQQASQQAQQSAQTQQNAHASKPSGVPAIEGDNKNSRVSTYA